MLRYIINQSKQRLTKKIERNNLNLDKETKKAFLDVLKGIDFVELYQTWLSKGGESGFFQELLYETMLNDLEKYYYDVYDKVDTDRKLGVLISEALPE